MGTITIKDGTEIYYPGNLYLDCLGGFLRSERPTVEGRSSARRQVLLRQSTRSGMMTWGGRR